MAKPVTFSGARGADEASAAGRRARGRNLVILCDGTGNELGGALSAEVSDIRISNVLKLYRIAEKGKRQLVYYTPGVGTIGRIDWLYRWKQRFLGVLASRQAMGSMTMSLVLIASSSRIGKKATGSSCSVSAAAPECRLAA